MLGSSDGELFLFPVGVGKLSFPSAKYFSLKLMDYMIYKNNRTCQEYTSFKENKLMDLSSPKAKNRCSTTSAIFKIISHWFWFFDLGILSLRFTCSGYQNQEIHVFCTIYFAGYANA